MNQLIPRKINLVFFVHLPQVWNSLKTICEAAINDKKFNVYILTFDSLSNECYDFFYQEYKNTKCCIIKYQTQQDFENLKADYVFYQVPYLHFYPNVNHEIVFANCKVCYMHYGMLLFAGEIEKSVIGGDYFFSKASVIFAENNFSAKKYLQYHPKSNIIVSGYPRFDLIKPDNIEFEKKWCHKLFSFFTKHNRKNIKDYLKSSRNQNESQLKTNKQLNIIWTPRWEIFSGTCHFFDYKDLLVDYVKQNDNTSFLFRPHPLALKNYVNSQEISQENLDNYLKNFENNSRIKIDRELDYLQQFYNSDVLITDMTSLIAEYFITEKPIIYCNKNNVFNDFGLEISKGLYWVNNWQELQNAIKMIKTGQDPLLETRKQIIKDLFYLQPQGAGNFIKNFIKADFKKSN